MVCKAAWVDPVKLSSQVLPSVSASCTSISLVPTPAASDSTRDYENNLAAVLTARSSTNRLYRHLILPAIAATAVDIANHFPTLQVFEASRSSAISSTGCSIDFIIDHRMQSDDFHSVGNSLSGDIDEPNSQLLPFVPKSSTRFSPSPTNAGSFRQNPQARERSSRFLDTEKLESWQTPSA